MQLDQPLPAPPPQAFPAPEPPAAAPPALHVEASPRKCAGAAEDAGALRKEVDELRTTNEALNKDLEDIKRSVIFLQQRAVAGGAKSEIDSTGKGDH